MAIAEKVSVVALGILAAMADFTLFLPFCIAGVGYGIYSALNRQNAAGHQAGSACSQGFLEQITGISLPQTGLFTCKCGSHSMPHQTTMRQYLCQ
jgi:hypothetical protein